MSLPPVMTPEEFSDLVLRLPYDEGHLKNLRHDGGLPHLRFRRGKAWFFRYPTSAVLEWVESRTHRGPGGRGGRNA